MLIKVVVHCCVSVKLAKVEQPPNTLPIVSAVQVLASKTFISRQLARVLLNQLQSLDQQIVRRIPTKFDFCQNLSLIVDVIVQVDRKL